MSQEEYQKALEAILLPNKQSFWYMSRETGHKAYGILDNQNHYAHNNLAHSIFTFKEKNPEAYKNTFQKIFNKFEKEEIEQEIIQTEKIKKIDEDAIKELEKKRKRYRNEESIYQVKRQIEGAYKRIGFYDEKNEKLKKRREEL